jgi:3-dehydroquinate synthase
MATTIRVALGERSYDIEISRGNLAQIASFLFQRRTCTHAVVVSDSNVSPTHGQVVASSLAAAGIRTDLLTIPAGESSKCVAEAGRLWNELAQRKADRKTVIVAVGGGVVGDLVGFVAATFGRGLSLVQVPTTLLAQVDSSVGGKVGINLPTAKNIVGAFWQPAGVVIDLAVLQTLPDREYRSGLAEVVKYGVILDAEFFAFLEENVPALIARESQVLEKVVAHSCQLKANVVQQDEREETGQRAVLNYGHTFCHAIETVTNYGHFLHGEAVAIGMICASHLAESLGLIGHDVTRRQRELLRKVGLPTEVGVKNKDELILAMQHDKKSEHGRLRFVLPRRLGCVELVGNVDPKLVRRALDGSED